MKSVKSSSLGLTIPFSIVGHIDAGLWRVQHSRLRGSPAFLGTVLAASTCGALWPTSTWSSSAFNDVWSEGRCLISAGPRPRNRNEREFRFGWSAGTSVHRSNSADGRLPDMASASTGWHNGRDSAGAVDVEFDPEGVVGDAHETGS